MSKTLQALLCATAMSFGVAHAQSATPATPAKPAEAKATPAAPAAPAAKKDEQAKCDPAKDKDCKPEAKEKK